MPACGACQSKRLAQQVFLCPFLPVSKSQHSCSSGACSMYHAGNGGVGCQQHSDTALNDLRRLTSGRQGTGRAGCHSNCVHTRAKSNRSRKRLPGCRGSLVARVCAAARWLCIKIAFPTRTATQPRGKWVRITHCLTNHTPATRPSPSKLGRHSRSPLQLCTYT
jgi:hypothetical protein